MHSNQKDSPLCKGYIIFYDSKEKFGYIKDWFHDRDLRFIAREVANKELLPTLKNGSPIICQVKYNHQAKKYYAADVKIV